MKTDAIHLLKQVPQPDGLPNTVGYKLTRVSLSAIEALCVIADLTRQLAGFSPELPPIEFCAGDEAVSFKVKHTTAVGDLLHKFDKLSSQSEAEVAAVFGRTEREFESLVNPPKRTKKARRNK